MPFPSSSVGLALQPFESSLSTRKVLAYAAGLGASDPAFLDDAQQGGLRALPFQCVSPEWPVVLSLREALGATLAPEEARRGVHAVQDSTFHRPMRAGVRVATRGRLTSATRIKAGVLTVCQLETRDFDSGELLTTTWTSSIYRDVELLGDPVILEAAPGIDASEAQPPGPEAEVVTIPIARELPHIYSECADIWNPIHTEREVALAAGLPDIILHGTATWALAGLAILRRYGRSDVAALKRITGRFAGMIVPGAEITVRHEPGPSGLVRFEVRNEAGALVISQGAAWF